ncbi:MAG: hypothetical protein H6739_38590 [Alphaproteobacteria bacterium]|nr:hypothetical protein [Alphaproteobacteria bacterium]
MSPLAIAAGFLFLAAVPSLVIKLPPRWNIAFWAALLLVSVGLWLALAPAEAVKPIEVARVGAYVIGCGLVCFRPAWLRLPRKAMPTAAMGLVVFMLFGGAFLRFKLGDWPGVVVTVLMILAIGGPRSIRWSDGPPSGGGVIDVGWAWILAYTAWHLAIGPEYLGHNLLGRKLFVMAVVLTLCLVHGPEQWLRLRLYIVAPQTAGVFIFPEVFEEAMTTPGFEFEGLRPLMNGIAVLLLIPAMRRNVRRWWRPDDPEV